MATDPHIEESWQAARVDVEVAHEFGFGWAATNILERGIDHPKADKMFGAGPTVGGRFREYGGVIVLVLGFAFVNAGRHSAGLFEIQRFAVVPIVAGGHDAVPIFVNGHVIEDIRIELKAIAGLTDGERRISWFVIEDAIDVEPMFSATE